MLILICVLYIAAAGVAFYAVRSFARQKLPEMLGHLDREKQGEVAVLLAMALALMWPLLVVLFVATRAEEMFRKSDEPDRR